MELRGFSLRSPWINVEPRGFSLRNLWITMKRRGFSMKHRRFKLKNPRFTLKPKKLAIGLWARSADGAPPPLSNETPAAKRAPR